MSGRTILCVAGSNNFAARLVQELGAGPCAEPTNQPAIENAIKALYRSWADGNLEVNPEVRAETVRRYSRAVLARQLATVLDGVIEDVSR